MKELDKVKYIIHNRKIEGYSEAYYTIDEQEEGEEIAEQLVAEGYEAECTEYPERSTYIILITW